ncbi:hypothetical protein FH620_37800, partial [Corallococcus exiguus]
MQHVLQRHGDEQQHQEGQAFPEGDEAETAQGGLQHDVLSPPPIPCRQGTRRYDRACPLQGPPDVRASRMSEASRPTPSSTRPAPEAVIPLRVD